MKNKLNLEECTQIEKGVTHHVTCFEPVMGAVAILEENVITDTDNVWEIDELIVLTNGVNFQSLQYR